MITRFFPAKESRQNVEEKQKSPNDERGEKDRSFRELYEQDRQNARRRESNQINQPQRESAAH